MKLLLATVVSLLSIACSCASDESKVLTPAVSPEAATETAAFDHSHALWTELLFEHAGDDGVDYRGMIRDREQLDRYLAMLQAVQPAELESWTREQRYSYWINVYNAHIVRLIVDNYPVESIRDLGGALVGRIWDKELIPLVAHHPKGKHDNLSFNDVEHEILRARFKDARVHAALNCASESCPALLNEAFVAERIEEQLDHAMRGFLADPRRNRIGASQRKVAVSAIFKWFSEDFERDAGSIRAYVAGHAELSSGDAGWIEQADISYLDYSWKLNDAR